jgi:hypothetical protein
MTGRLGLPCAHAGISETGCFASEYKRFRLHHAQARCSLHVVRGAAWTPGSIDVLALRRARDASRVLAHHGQPSPIHHPSLIPYPDRKELVMKRRNDSKKLGLTKAAVRELKPEDFMRTDGAALSGNIGVISPISPISPVAPIAPIFIDDPTGPIEC